MDNKKIVAVRLTGCFTEWYSPNYKEPYEDNEEYRKWYGENLIDFQPIMGPSIGESEEENIVDDLPCLCERISCDVTMDEWTEVRDALCEEVKKVLADGVERVFHREGMEDVTITPFTKETMPPVNEKSLEVYGPFKELFRKRVMDI